MLVVRCAINSTSCDSYGFIVSYHWASSAPPLEPFALPGGHTGGLELLSDQTLLRPVLHLLQPAQSLLVVHVPAAVRQEIMIVSLSVNKNVCELVLHHIYHFPPYSTDISLQAAQILVVDRYGFFWWPMLILLRAGWPMSNIKPIN